MQDKEYAPKKRGTSPPSTGGIWGLILTNALLWISLLTLGVGIFAPVMTFKKLIFFKSTFSIHSGLVTLFKEGEYLLFLIISVFAILFPMVKIILLFLVQYQRSGSREIKERILHALGLVSKWSMLDVFIVAILVVIVRLGISGRVDVRWGIYVFALSVVLSTLATQKLTRSQRNA